MARQINRRQPLKTIYVFWEGESEAAYTRFLKQEFGKCAVIRSHHEKGTFFTAQAFYRGNKRFKSDLSELDEIWFFFDTEVDQGRQWGENMACLEAIIHARSKRNPIKIRLLMTSCCVEYWLLLHYEKTAPSMATPADKERMLSGLRRHAPGYEKGDIVTTTQIARNYRVAVENGRWTLNRLYEDGMPQQEEERNRWLFNGTHTFTTVHETIEALLTWQGLK